jgi:hypothetical protein
LFSDAAGGAVTDLLLLLAKQSADIQPALTAGVTIDHVFSISAALVGVGAGVLQGTSRLRTSDWKSQKPVKTTLPFDLNPTVQQSPAATWVMPVQSLTLHCP